MTLVQQKRNNSGRLIPQTHVSSTGLTWEPWIGLHNDVGPLEQAHTMTPGAVHELQQNDKDSVFIIVFMLLCKNDTQKAEPAFLPGKQALAKA